MVKAELAQLKFTDELFELDNPKYQAGSDKPFLEWTLRTTLKPEQAKQLLTAIQERFNQTPVFPSSNRIGGKVAGDTQLIALYALLASMADYRDLHLDPVPERDLRAGRGAGLGPRRVRDDGVFGDELLFVAVPRLCCWSIRSRSAWRSWRRC